MKQKHFRTDVKHIFYFNELRFVMPSSELDRKLLLKFKMS